MISSLWWVSAFCSVPISSNISGFWTAKSRVKKQTVVGEATRRHPSASTDVTLNRHLKEFSVLVSFTPRSSSSPKQSSTIHTQEFWSLCAQQVVVSHAAGTRMSWSLLDLCYPAVLQQFNNLYWLKRENPPPQEVTWIKGQDFMG